MNSASERKCMADYEPISRRPIAAVFRRTAKAATRFCVRWGIHPDAISYLSILAALVAAFCFWQSHTAPWLLITAPMFCYLRLWFNMLDGMVALAAGKATARGEILNDLPDRISDIVIFVGVALSGWMSKPWRMVALHIGAWMTLACWWWNDQSTRFQSLTIFDWTCIVVIGGCVQTIAARLKRIMAALERRTK